MSKPGFIYIINPHLFQWNTHWYEDGRYLLEAYATNEDANLVASRPFIEIRGIGNGMSVPKNSISNQVSLFDTRLNRHGKYSGFYAFYGITRIEDGQIIMEEVFPPISPKDFNEKAIEVLRKTDEEKICIFAKRIDGYIQPIVKSWMYEILKASLVNLHSDSVFPSSIVYMVFKTWKEVPVISSVTCSESQMIDKDHNYSKQKNIFFDHFITRFLFGCEKWDSYVSSSHICSYEELSTNSKLRNRIIKRKTLFPVSRKKME